MTNTQKRYCFSAIILLLVLLQPGILMAQESSQKDESEAVYSMGLPSRNEFYWGPLMVFDQTSKGTKFGGQLYAGVTHYLMSPLFGAGIGLEGYGQAMARLWTAKTLTDPGRSRAITTGGSSLGTAPGGGRDVWKRLEHRHGQGACQCH